MLEDQRQTLAAMESYNMAMLVTEVIETIELSSQVGSEEMMAFTVQTKGAGSSEREVVNSTEGDREVGSQWERKIPTGKLRYS